MHDPSEIYTKLSKAKRRCIIDMHTGSEPLMRYEMPDPKPSGMSLTLLSIEAPPLLERIWISGKSHGSHPVGDGYAYRLTAIGRAVKDAATAL